MTDHPDISPEAVERLAREMDERVEAFDAMITVQLESVRETRRTRGAETRQQHESIAATLRAQAERIKELEVRASVSEEQTLLWFNAAMDARTKAKAARNDALREAAHLIPRYFGVWSSSGVHIGVWDDGPIAAAVLSEYPDGIMRDLIPADAILALIEGEQT